MFSSSVLSIFLDSSGASTVSPDVMKAVPLQFEGNPNVAIASGPSDNNNINQQAFYHDDEEYNPSVVSAAQLIQDGSVTIQL